MNTSKKQNVVTNEDKYFPLGVSSGKYYIPSSDGSSLVVFTKTALNKYRADVYLKEFEFMQLEYKSVAEGYNDLVPLLKEMAG